MGVSGAMVLAGRRGNRCSLTKTRFWAGGPYDPNNPVVSRICRRARRLIFAGKYAEAATLIGDKMMAKPIRQMPHTETVGRFDAGFSGLGTNVSDYRRDLDLETATAHVAYTADGVKFAREYFSSSADQVIVVRLSADKPGQISFVASMKTPQDAKVTAESPDFLVMRGVNGSSLGISFR